MKINAIKTLFSASLFINDLFINDLLIADLLILRQSVQQIRVPNNHPPNAVLAHVGEPAAGIDPESRERRDWLRFQQGPVQQQNAIVFCFRLKHTIPSQKKSRGFHLGNGCSHECLDQSKSATAT